MGTDDSKGDAELRDFLQSQIVDLQMLVKSVENLDRWALTITESLGENLEPELQAVVQEQMHISAELVKDTTNLLINRIKNNPDKGITLVQIDTWLTGMISCIIGSCLLHPEFGQLASDIIKKNLVRNLLSLETFSRKAHAIRGLETILHEFGYNTQN